MRISVRYPLTFLAPFKLTVQRVKSSSSCKPSSPFLLALTLWLFFVWHKDEDLISYIQGILDKRVRTTVQVVKVNRRHATDEMVGDGKSRREDKDGK